MAAAAQTPGPLFRPQAIAARAELLHCEGSNPLSLSHRVFSLLSLLFICLVAALLYHGHYTSRQTVRGFVTTTEANVRIHARQPGTVTRLFVSEGETVAAGDPLLRIEDPRNTVALDINATLQRSLQKEQSDVSAEQERAKTLQAAEIAATQEALANVARQLDGLRRQQDLAAEQQELAAAHYRRLLHAGQHIAAIEQRRARSGQLDAEQRQVALERERIQQLATRDELRLALAALPLRHADHMARLQSRQEQLRQQSANVHAATDSLLLAPLAGRISGLTVRAGSAVQAQQVMLTLLPVEARYVVELLVPNRAAGFLGAGDPVLLRFDAFPHQRFGVVRGSIISVTDSALIPGESLLPETAATGGYRVRVALTHAEDGRQPPLPLRVGMTATADLLQERRRLIEWLVAPMRNAARNLAP